MEWLQENDQWVFSGFGVAIGTLILTRIFKKNGGDQTVKGNNNTQGGGDVVVKKTNRASAHSG